MRQRKKLIAEQESDFIRGRNFLKDERVHF